MPDQPIPPPELAPGVGAGEFRRTGNEIVGLTMVMAGLNPDDRVLDIGCGLGRAAWPFSRLLDERGTYDGFDASAAYIAWCRDSLSLDPERFRFHHFDLYSSHYNPAGTIASESFVFPWPDGAFTLAIANSLFTHVSAAAVANYLRQIARTLDKGGRLFASFFVLDDASRPLAEAGKTHPPFTSRFAEGMWADPADPDNAVAFDAQWLADTLQAAGLTFEAFYPGRWRQIAAAQYQDVVIARR
jgi:SAM-dependent methyltransferase